MKDLIPSVLPWLLSANTIYFNILAGNRKNEAWAWALGGQIGWTVWIIASEQWGFMPMNMAMWIVYTRNHFKWSNH